MIWEAHTKHVGDWIESKVAVARDGQDYSWVGQLMMRSDEWQDFARRSGLREGDDGVWRSQ
jgi:hypothetical protein